MPVGVTCQAFAGEHINKIKKLFDGFFKERKLTFSLFAFSSPV